MAANVVQLHAPTDLAEEIHRTRLRLQEISNERVRRWHEEAMPTMRTTREVRRRFVDDDLTVRSGKRKGQPLTQEGRRRLLHDLIDAERSLERGCWKEEALCDETDRLEARLKTLYEHAEAHARHDDDGGEA